MRETAGAQRFCFFTLTHTHTRKHTEEWQTPSVFNIRSRDTDRDTKSHVCRRMPRPSQRRSTVAPVPASPRRCAGCSIGAQPSSEWKQQYPPTVEPRNKSVGERARISEINCGGDGTAAAASPAWIRRVAAKGEMSMPSPIAIASNRSAANRVST